MNFLLLYRAIMQYQQINLLDTLNAYESALYQWLGYLLPVIILTTILPTVVLSGIFFRQFRTLSKDRSACMAHMLQAAVLYTQFRQEGFYLTAQFN